ncbi:MAG: GTP-binding protein [Bacteriovoracaceae bacterium]
METIIVIVGFLGAGKTTLLKKLVKSSLEASWNPYIILNDYQNANLDAQQFLEFLGPDQVNPLHGSCICCSGVHELRKLVNAIPKRDDGITLIEANGTTDACSLMEFLGVGLDDHFLPPVQVSVVDVKNWQKRGFNNELEANQIQVSSLIVLNHLEDVDDERIEFVKSQILELNPFAKIERFEDLNEKSLIGLSPSKNQSQKMDHQKAHWSSCSVDLPDPLGSEKLGHIMETLPESILRVKGCTRLNNDSHYTYFERVPSGQVIMKPYRGNLVTGPKLLVIGPGSNPETLKEIVAS